MERVKNADVSMGDFVMRQWLNIMKGESFYLRWIEMLAGW